eukprot:TRINITY_DN27183_c0_g1_i1.p1 TRINITY_DN27183_c0_g1~~TRINITY_DN27183_c0_g1_i1.p1  ORF type:complete len:467 (+),score=91.30 TRINITY_DN27183_c0_g1_i1:87-1487(+)
MSRTDSAAAVAAVLADPQLSKACAQSVGKHAEASFSVDEACARRYLRAVDGDVGKAIVALKTTLEWRAVIRPAQVECSACVANPLSHNMRVVGIDAAGRPVLYTCFSQALHRFDPMQGAQHLTRTLEDACAVLAARARRRAGDACCGEGGAAPETCVWFVDFHGYSFIKDSNPRTAILAARLLAHYPERLGRCVLLDAPPVFSGTWTAVKRVINSVTASKVHFVRSSDGSLERELDAWLPERAESGGAGGSSDAGASSRLRLWLLREVAENRLAASQSGGKAYWSEWQADGTLKEHDPRAVSDFVTSPEFALTLTSRLERFKPRRDQRLRSHSDNAVCTGMALEAVGQDEKGRCGQFLGLILLTCAVLCAAAFLVAGWRGQIAVGIAASLGTAWLVVAPAILLGRGPFAPPTPTARHSGGGRSTSTAVAAASAGAGGGGFSCSDDRSPSRQAPVPGFLWCFPCLCR